MLKRILVCLLFLSLVFPLGATTAEIVPLSSSVYRDMESLYQLQGLATPSNAKPWSHAEIRLMLSRLNPERLSIPERKMYQRIQMELDRDAGKSFVLRPGLSIALEAYAHTNGTVFDMDTDWVNGYDTRNPFAKGWLELGISDFLYTYCELAYGWGRVTHADTIRPIVDVFADKWYGVGALIPKDKNKVSNTLISTHSDIYSRAFLFNFPDIRMLEIDTPRRAVFALGGEHWMATVSRDKIDWGNSHIGNFIFDSHVDYQEYFRFKAFSDKLSLDIVTLFMDTNYNSENSSVFDGDLQLFLTHRLEYRPWKWLSMAVSENIMYRAPEFELRFLNPAFIFHNLNNSKIFNAIAHAELDVTIVPGVNLYGQFVLDQATAPTEPNSQAPAWGVSGGVGYTDVFGSGVFFTNLEYAYTAPMLYRRENVDFLMFHKYATNVNYKKVLVFDYIGFPYGGDAQVLQLEVGYRVPSLFSADLRIRAIRHGEMDFFHSHNTDNDNTDIPNIKDSTPYGTVVTDTLNIGLRGEYEFPDWVSFVSSSAYAQIDWVGRRAWNKTSSDTSTESDFQFSLGIRLTI